MRGILLLLPFLSLAALVSALTTGPYNIGDGDYQYSDASKISNFYASQGVAINVFNTTRQCSVKGSGINIASTTFRFGTIFNFPNRVNTSNIFLIANYGMVTGIPSNVVNIFANAGATSIMTSQSSLLTIAQFQDGGSILGTSVKASNGPSEGISTPIRAGAAFTYAPLTKPSSVAGFDASVVVPYNRTSTTEVKFSQGYITFNLTGAGKEANVTCQAPSRSPTTGWANFFYQGTLGNSSAGFALGFPRYNAGLPGFPPLDTTTAVSGYSPNCTFTGIGKFPLQISLAGLKSNALVSTSSPIKFSQGQTNINLTYPVTQFLRTAYPSAAKASIKLSAFNVTVTNASPATKNLVPSTGYTSAVYALPNSASTFAVPSLPSGAPASTFPAVSFTPTKLGTGATAVLSQGAVRGTINLYNSASALVAAVPLRCDNTGSQPVVVPYDIA